ncbi:MAG: response regulator [Verrucomicrobiota bacterium]
MKRILIIEDDKLVGNIYRTKFAAEGFAVELAGDGEGGLAALKKAKPDLVLLDLMLPKVSGVEIIKQIRANAQMRAVPVVVLSNSYLGSVIQDAWKAGANKCLSKADCTPRQLTEMVRDLLREGEPAGKAAKPSAPASAPVSEADSDAAFQADLRRTFADSAPGVISILRKQLAGVTKGAPEARRAGMTELFARVRSFAGNAAVAGVTPVARMASALEALLKELSEKPESLNPSTLRTVAQAVDTLADLLKHPVEPLMVPPAILVLDDEVISRRAVVYALEKAGLKCLSMEDPMAALAMLSENRFDLVFLDVDMPGMTGFDLCKKLRALPGHEKTPVVFVTSLSDFESRAKSALSGGNDLIAKPFIFMELAVKALIYLARRQPRPAGDGPN